MARAVLILSFLFSSTSLAGGANDFELHLYGSAALTQASYLYAKKNEFKYPILFSVGFSLAVGVAKEMNDERFDWNDIGADALGVGLGLVVPLYIERF